MALKLMRFLNLLLAGVLTGNEFGGFVGFHPALYELPTEAHARAFAVTPTARRKRG